MEMADYWMLEKDLVPKLFKVLATRYETMRGPYTKVHKLPVQYPGGGQKKIILELVNNPYPPVTPPERDFSKSLTNILLSAYRADKTMFKKDN